MLGTLIHMFAIDRHYIAALRGESVESGPSRTSCPDLSSLGHAQRESDRVLVAFCEELAAGSLPTLVRWIGDEGDLRSDPVHVVLSHLFLHQIHHRGQVHNMLSLAGVKPPQLDEFFLSHDAPLREQEIHELDLGK